MGRESNIKIVLSELRYKSAPPTTSFLNVPFIQNTKLLTEFDRSQKINLYDVYVNEREKSTLFRPSVKITYLFKNTYIGETNYTPFTENLYYVNALASVRQACAGISDVYWSGYPLYNEFDLGRTDNDTDGYTEPNTNGHINFVTTSATSYNWNFFLSYAYDNVQRFMTGVDQKTGVRLNWNSANGIPFIIFRSTYNGQNFISFRCLGRHGLSVYEFVELSFSYGGQNVFQVTRLGDNLYGSQDFIFNIPDFGYTGTTFSEGVTGTFKRVIDENNVESTRSEYYVRRQKIITKNSDAVLTNSGFELNPFKVIKQYEPSALTPNNISRVSVKEGSQSYNLNFLNNVSIQNLVDNQKRPLSELFFTFQWIGYLGWTNKPTLGQKSLRQGWAFNLPLYEGKPDQWWTNDPSVADSNSYISEINTSSYVKTPTNSLPRTFYYNVPLDVDDIIDGDFCEWNDFEFKERVVSELYHKITYNENVFNINITGESNPNNPLGFYYQTHHPMTIKKFSSYIEEGDPAKVSEIPNWAIYNQSTKTFFWRDVYPYGYIDPDGVGVDFPFLNGAHYPFKNIVFRLIPEGSTSISLSTVVQQPTTDDCE
jgi:hypothetical protein